MMFQATRFVAFVPGAFTGGDPVTLPFFLESVLPSSFLPSPFSTPCVLTLVSTGQGASGITVSLAVTLRGCRAFSEHQLCEASRRSPSQG